MNAFLNPRNVASLTNIIGVTDHSISLWKENEQPKNINGTFIHKPDISIAEPIEVQLGELVNNTTQVYQLIGIINDEKVGQESFLNCMNDNFVSKYHHYHMTKEQYNEETHNIYNIDKANICNIKHSIYTNEFYYNKAQNKNTDITNNISKTKTLHLIANMY